MDSDFFYLLTKFFPKWNQTSAWIIVWWILVAPAFTLRAKNRTILVGQRYSSSVGTATRWIGKTWHPCIVAAPLLIIHTHTQTHGHTHPKPAIPPLCWGPISETNPAGSANHNALCPYPLDCHHLFDAMSGACGLRSWPETTTATQLRSSVSQRDIIGPKGPRRCQRCLIGYQTHTCTCTHASTHWHN